MKNKKQTNVANENKKITKKPENIRDIEIENVEKLKEETLSEQNEEKMTMNNMETNDNISESEKPMSKKEQIIQFLKFLGFSLSAGVIQILSFELLYNWIGWKVWWASYLISIVLSVLWNFTFNRKFTFKSASNIPVAMTLVFLYYCVFTPISVFGGNALEGIGWNGTLVTFLMMVLNFVTEYVWDKFIVFNEKITNKILRIFAKK